MTHLKIFYENGLSHDSFVSDVISVNYSGHFKLEETKYLPDADIAIYGPYGSSLPSDGHHIKVAYICENWIPDGLDVDYIFGVKPYAEIQRLLSKHAKYFQIRWHGINPLLLELDKADKLLEWKMRPRSFLYLYSARSLHRERVCKYLLKKFDIDCPGKSLNNLKLPSLSPRFALGERDTKLALLRKYKFVFAIENYISNGYQTEKLYDAYLAGCIPIYLGDPNINEIFNKNSMLNLLPRGPFFTFLLRLSRLGDLRYSEIIRSSRPLPRLRWRIRSGIRKLFLLCYTMFMARRIEYEINSLFSNPRALFEIVQSSTFCKGVDPYKYLNSDAWDEIFRAAHLRKVKVSR